MKYLIILPFLLMVLLFSSCLVYQHAEYRIQFDDDFKTGKIMIIYRDIRSSHKDMEKRAEDFEELIKMLEGDMFLLDATDEGIYVTERKLFEKGGLINGYYKGIFKNLRIDDEPLKEKNNERMLVLNTENGERVEANGKTYQSENSTIIVWPKDQQELIIKITHSFDQDTYPLVDPFKNWQASRSN